VAGHPLAVALGLLRADAPGRIMGVPQDWPRWVVLLPHVLAATGHLDRAAGAPGTTASTDAAWLLDRAGTYLRVHARSADARGLEERALAIDEAAHGPDHPTVAVRLNNLALTLRALGQPAATVVGRARRDDLPQQPASAPQGHRIRRRNLLQGLPGARGHRRRHRQHTGRLRRLLLTNPPGNADARLARCG
jgi:hypothetical protein